MLTFYNRTRRAPHKKTRRYELKHRVASGYCYNQMQHIKAYLLETKHKRRNAVYEYLERTYHVKVCDKRISVSGGVGSVQWMPKFGCYRIQVGSNHITTKKPCFNYAPCIELYDI